MEQKRMNASEQTNPHREAAQRMHRIHKYTV